MGFLLVLVDYAPKVEATLLHVGERLTASGVQKKGRHKDGPGTDNKEAESRTGQSRAAHGYSKRSKASSTGARRKTR